MPVIVLYCVHSLISLTALNPHFPMLWGGGGGGGKCGVHLCCNTCCEHVQLISIELPLLANYAWNGQIYCNWIPRIPGI